MSFNQRNKRKKRVKLERFVTRSSTENISLEGLLSNCFFPLFCRNLTAKFDKKKRARFHKIN